jgi:hypothetical protein
VDFTLASIFFLPSGRLDKSDHTTGELMDDEDQPLIVESSACVSDD